ncbi:MAG: hypothetical protein Kow00103_14370 [Candidatus Caldatribacteriota bacterium]
MNTRMDCLKTKQLLNEYLEQLTDEDFTNQIKEHLCSCPHCQQEYQRLQKLISSLRSLTPQQASADFTDKVMAKIAQEKIEINPSFWKEIKRKIAVPLPSLPSFRIIGVSAALLVVFLFFAFNFIFKPGELTPLCSAEVEFSLRVADNQKIQTIAIAGDFNNWNPQANILQDSDGDGIWTTTLKLPPGRYEYMFVLNGEKWLPDPNALRYVKDGFGNRNAILEVNNCSST